MERTPENILLELDGAGMVYRTPQGETEALRDVSFSVERGGFTALVGPSGCGKSTVLSLIAGLLTPSCGRILLNCAGAHPVGYMLQHDHLFPWRTVWENVCLGPELQHELTAARREYIGSLLTEYGLGEFRDRFPRQLSGGMRQRAALIRTLATDPELLLLDEPFSALDFQTRIKVSEDIGSIIRSRGKTALLVTHDIAEAISLADRVLILSPRPGTIQKEVVIRMDAPAGQVRRRRQDAAFSGYFELIWKEMNGDA